MAVASFEITSNTRKIVARFAALPQRAQRAVAGRLRSALLVVESRVLRGADLKWRRGGAGLAGRLASFVRLGGPRGIDAEIGFRRTSGFPYELAQEFGARARPGGAMSIPVTAEARSAGGASRFGGALFRPAGTHVLAERVGRQLQVHYVLVKSIPPSLHFRRSVERSMPLIEDAILGGMDAAAERS
jgi:hypothetical protein